MKGATQIKMLSFASTEHKNIYLLHTKVFSWLTGSNKFKHLVSFNKTSVVGLHLDGITTQ